MTSIATLSSKFQIFIPKAVREEQHWEAGQEFVFIPKGKGVLVMPVPELDQFVVRLEIFTMKTLILLTEFHGKILACSTVNTG